MSVEEMTNSVETIEVKAEKVLEEARNKANEILLGANEEVSKLLSTELPVEEVKAECEEIIQKAREEADRRVEDSRKKAAEIRATVSKKTDAIATRIVSNITGAKLG